MKHVRILALFTGVALLITALVFPVYTAAQQSQLQQTITGMSDPVPPTIDTIVSTSGQPIIVGTYDAVNSQSFHVCINGVCYVLGIDPELTAFGNNWILNLSNLEPPLIPGVYEITAEMIDFGDTVLTTIALLTISDGGMPPGTGGGDGDGDLPSTGQSASRLQPAILFLLIAGIGGIVMSRRYRLEK